MFHNHAYLFLHVGLKVPKGGDFLQRECSPLHRSSREVSSNFFLRVSPQPISRSLACLVSRLDLSFFKYLMAGVRGFEPLNTRVKVLCLSHLTTPQYIGRDDRIRTCGILVPNQALYQTEPHPDRKWGCAPHR